MEWYYIKNGEKEGPLSNADIPLFVKRGDITDDTLVWNSSMTDWAAYSTVKDAPQDTPEEEAETTVLKTDCSMCGKQFAANELIEFEGSRVCAACKPEFVQQIRENAEISGASILHYAGFWIRFGAVFIDGIIMYLMNLPVLFLFGLLMPAMSRASENPNDPMFWSAFGIMYILQIILPALYMILMHGKFGATLGKKAVGIKVVMPDGTPISYGRAAGRYFGYILSGLLMNIGYLIAAFDDEKRALHDHICTTRVIKTRGV